MHQEDFEFTSRVVANNPNFLIDSLSYFGNFSEDFLFRNSNKLNWELLSANENQIWSYNLLAKYRDKLNWRLLSENVNIPWDEFLIDEFFHEIDWGKSNDDYSFGISHNPSLPFSIEFIRRYQNKWNWTWLSSNKGIPLSEPLIEEFYDKWDWELLSTNISLPLTKVFIQRYSKDLNWKVLSKNKSLRINEDLIREFEDYWDWEKLTANEALVLSEDLILKFSHKLAWHKILANDTLTNSLYVKFHKKIEWEPFSKISSRLIFSDDFLDTFKDNIDFKTCYFNLPYISTTILKKFQNRWDWEKLSIAESKFAGDVFEEYKDWHWVEISSNENLPWSPKFLEKHKEDFFWRTKVETNAFGIGHYHGLSTNPQVFKLLFSGLEESNIEDLLENSLEVVDPFPPLDYKSYKDFHPYSGFDYLKNYREEYQETIYDNPYYNDELDFDQQGPDFDF